MTINRLAIAVVASVAVFAGVSASAATLGTITTTDVGAGSQTIKGPYSAVTVSYTTAYEPLANSGAGAYIVTGVTVTPGSTFAAGALVSATLKGSTGTALATVSGTSTATASITMAVSQSGSLGIPVADVLGVSVVINGTTTTASVATK
ncbi:MAG: hypothetical protein V4479_07300 [Actinomycetota bacterium]